jgi:hypothetical protein
MGARVVRCAWGLAVPPGVRFGGRGWAVARLRVAEQAVLQQLGLVVHAVDA